MTQDGSLVSALTEEVVEACVSRTLAQLENGETELPDSDVRREKEVFSCLIRRSSLFKDYFIQIAVALYDPNGIHSATECDTAEALRNLLLEKIVTEDRLALLLATISDFFFYGWHSRGAISEATELERMMNNSADAEEAQSDSGHDL